MEVEEGEDLREELERAVVEDRTEWKILKKEEKVRRGASLRRVKTAPRYVAVVTRFLDWAEEEKWIVRNQEDADYIAYLFGEWVIMRDKPKSWLLPPESALKYFDPESKKQSWPWLQEAR